MKLISIVFILILFNAIFGQCEDNEYSTIGILDDINEEIYNDDESVNAYSIYSWSSDDLNRILSGNGIPNHEVGTFPNPNNPNSISAQNVNSDSLTGDNVNKSHDGDLLSTDPVGQAKILYSKNLIQPLLYAQQ